MLEFYVESGFWLRQLRECAIGDRIDPFAEWLQCAGFRRRSAQLILRGAAHLGEWASIKQVRIEQFDQRVLDTSVTTTEAAPDEIEVTAVPLTWIMDVRSLPRFDRPLEVSIRQAAAIYQIAIFVNWLLPIRGGEVVMSLLLRRTDRIPVNRSLAAVSMDKAMDLLPAAGLLAVMPFVGLPLTRQHRADAGDRV